MPFGFTSPFHGLPPLVAGLFWLALIIIVGMLLWSLTLFLRGWRTSVNPPDVPEDAADRFTWVFLVPALNEEVTIADSVARLLALPVKKRRVVVIDDGSDDRTAEILAGVEHPDLIVVRRVAPNARKGKAAALNNAYFDLRHLLGDIDRSDVIVAIIDADGRLDAEAPRYAASQFADPRVGGVQSLVRIYNRQEVLTWFQHIEFAVYGHLFQVGRNGWGTAGMGGNGQFNRLSTLDDIAGAEGPWRDRLTEDQDLGLRLIGQGWEGRQELRARVDQQGVPSLRRLFRQRTRWSQGNLEALSLTSTVIRSPFSIPARIELLIYLFNPIWQAIVGLATVVAVALAVLGQANFWDGSYLELAFVYILAFGGTILGCVSARRGEGARGWFMGFLIGQAYAFYTWLLWPVLVFSTYRLLTSQNTWAKTDREQIEPGTTVTP
jgi:1,2-diacylglycerol 3-beta-glucosyltransferase